MEIEMILRWKNQEIGIGCGQNFIIPKNIMAISTHF